MSDDTARVLLELSLLEGVIDESLPHYELDDGTGEEANFAERVEYAGEELGALQRKLTLAEQQRDELAEALRALDRASSHYIENDDHEWWQALGTARAALAKYDATKGPGNAGQG